MPRCWKHQEACPCQLLAVAGEAASTAGCGRGAGGGALHPTDARRLVGVTITALRYALQKPSLYGSVRYGRVWLFVRKRNCSILEFAEGTPPIAAGYCDWHPGCLDGARPC